MTGRIIGKKSPQSSRLVMCTAFNGQLSEHAHELPKRKKSCYPSRPIVECFCIGSFGIVEMHESISGILPIPIDRLLHPS